MTLDGFKVVRKTEDGRYISATECGKVVEYTIGQRTVPPKVQGEKTCGPLTVFRTLKHAREFEQLERYHCQNLVIFKCKYLCPRVQYSSVWYYTDEGLKNSLHHNSLCIGAFLAEWIELIEEVS